MSKRNLSIGTWLTIPNEVIAEIFAQSGFEWIVIDLEHSAININQAEKLIRVIDLAGSKPMVRLSGHDPNQIKRVLDFGASGIIAPMVDTYEQGKNILEASKYYPDGKRSMGLYRAQGYGSKLKKEQYLTQTSKEIKVYFQVESKECVENVEKIFELPIDGYFIGPYDLSTSLGAPGDFNSSKFVEAEEFVLNVAKKRGLERGFHLVEPSPEELENLFNKGYSNVAYSVDFRMLENASSKPFE